MELQTSIIHRRLESKIKIVGMELHDLLFVLIFASLMNLLFGQTALGGFLSIPLPIAFAFLLYFIKRNKPEGYLKHLLRYHFDPGFLSAGQRDVFEEKRKMRIYDL